MKVELTKETNPDGKVWFYVYADGNIIESFLGHREKEAREFYESYGKVEPKTETLETKEV